MKLNLNATYLIGQRIETDEIKKKENSQTMIYTKWSLPLFQSTARISTDASSTCRLQLISQNFIESQQVF